MYVYMIGLQGTKSKDRTILTYDLGDPVDHAAALNAANQIRGAFVDVSDANIRFEKLVEVLAEDNQLPADADTTDELIIATHLNAPAEAEKIHNLRVPAPIAAAFLPDGITLDTTNALVVQYVQQVAQHSFVSDGEQIDTNSGTNGISKGYWRSRAKVLK